MAEEEEDEQDEMAASPPIGVGAAVGEGID